MEKKERKSMEKKERKRKEKEDRRKLSLKRERNSLSSAGGFMSSIPLFFFLTTPDETCFVSLIMLFDEDYNISLPIEYRSPIFHSLCLKDTVFGNQCTNSGHNFS